MLRPLVRATEADTTSGALARLRLAEQLLLANPSSAWEALTLLGRVLAVSGNDELTRRALTAKGLALTVLCHYRAARAAYVSALGIDPAEPVSAHNLGHLLIVKFGSIDAGIYWLEVAHRSLPHDAEIVASLAHALTQAGNPSRARRLLERCVGASSAAMHIEDWAKTRARR
jgi:Flp pilus assembly protein TadD